MTKDIQNPFDNEDSGITTSAFDASTMQPIDSDASGKSVAWFLMGIGAVGCCALFIVAFVFFKPDVQSLADTYFPSPTVTPSPTLTPTPTITPSPTLPSTPTPNMTAQAYESTAVAAERTWTQLVAENFDTNQADWYTGSDEDELNKITYKVENGKYIWDAVAVQGFVQRMEANPLSVGDFYFSVETYQSITSTSAAYGVYFRENNAGDYYYFSINDNGEYSFWLYNNDWTELISNTYTPAIQTGETNKIAILAEGDRFVFFINDLYVTEFQDATLDKGGTGLALEIGTEGEQSVVEFDNVLLLTPK